MTERELFIAAVQIDNPAGRSAYLDRACSAKADLRERVEALLDAFARAGSFLQQPADGPPAASGSPPNNAVGGGMATEAAGSMVGPYKLLQRIGEGGMGAVWMAEQTDPVQRKVAVKLTKAGTDSRQVVARFEAERQALALMDHPNIAKVLDAGTTDSGRPYFIMELVKGVPITRYCDERRLTPRERLELFVPVCQAVQHAHQKGIIHRDLKPSNVLVCMYDGRPVPKVIDFGVAKATGPRLTDKTLFTEIGSVVGTLEYMSPEQAELNQLDVDTRSDVYSLGVILYELLTGTTPLERRRFKEAAFLEVLRLIREEESPRPSTRLSMCDGLPSIAANRGLEPKRLNGLVRGELDWIVMRALEKDRNRRYDSPVGLSQDVERYLTGDAVQACPPSARYRLRKFARRKKVALLAGSALALALLLAVGAVAASIGWANRDREARRAVIAGKVDLALEEAESLFGQKRWADALAAVRRAAALTTDAAAWAGRQQRIADFEADLDMVFGLEEVHGKPLQPDYYTGEELDAVYAELFRGYGIDVNSLDVAEAAARLRGRSIVEELVIALDDWAGMRRRRKPDAAWTKLLTIAQAVDSDPWRNRLRTAWERNDRSELEHLAATISTDEVAPGTSLLLGSALCDLGAVDTGIRLLRRAQQRYPNDLWLNDALAVRYCWIVDPPRFDDALRFYTAALAVRPDNHRLHTVVGNVQRERRALDEATLAYSRAIELKPTELEAWLGRGMCHLELGQWTNALDDFALHNDTSSKRVIVWRNRRATFFPDGKLATSPPQPQRSGRLNKNYGLDLAGAGAVMDKSPAWEQAVAAFTEATRHSVSDSNLNSAFAWLLATCPDEKFRDPRRAISLAETAVKFMPGDYNCWLALGVSRFRAGSPKECADAIRQAMTLGGGGDSRHWYVLAMAHHQLHENREALERYRQAVTWHERNKPKDAELARFRAETEARLVLTK
jgi:serine/threonine protein kinase